MSIFHITDIIIYNVLVMSLITALHLFYLPSYFLFFNLFYPYTVDITSIEFREAMLGRDIVMSVAGSHPFDKFDETCNQSVLTSVNQYSDRFIKRIELVSRLWPGTDKCIDISFSITCNPAEICIAPFFLDDLALRSNGNFLRLQDLKYRSFNKRFL